VRPNLSSKDPALPLRHILQAIERIEQHVAGMDFAAYRDDPKTADAVERNLQRISEAAIRLGEQGAVLCPDIPWADVRGIGNWLRHQYDRIEQETIWNTVTESLPPLKACVVKALRASAPKLGGPDLG
jgi:uncharacterized protein with HEPN domain